MPVTRENKAITWPAGGVVPGGGQLESNAFTLEQDTINASVHVNGDNASGSPGANDSLEIYLLQSGDGAKYDGARPEHAELLGEVNTNAGDDEQITREIPTSSISYKLLAINSGATNSITVTSSVTEQRAQ